MEHRAFRSCPPGGVPPAPGLTPIDVRDMIVDCLTGAHGARFAAHRDALGLSADPGAVRESVEGMVRLAFKQARGDFDHPDSASLCAAVNILAERSLSWGTATDVVFEHHCAITRSIGVLQIARG